MKAGFCTADITPELGIYLTGYGRPERLATNVHSPLLAAVMYLADGGNEAAVVSLDWCFVDEELVGEIRAGISAATGIPVKNLIVSCTHTHSAPNTTVFLCKWRGAVDPEQKGAAYARKCIPVIAGAVKTAKDSARPAAVAISAGKTKTGISRRSTHEDGVVNFLFGDPNMIYDDNMTVARFIDLESKANLGIFIHASAHNTAMGITTDISSDWTGVMRQRIQTRYPEPVVFVNGALGGVGPRTNRWLTHETGCGFSGGCGDGVWSVLEVGLRAATDALELLADQRDFRADLPLKIHSGIISVPQKIHMSEADAQKILDEKPSPDECNMAEMVIKALHEPLRGNYVYEQNVIALGPLALVPFPWEMFSIFSLRLRKYAPFQYALCISYGNGYKMYMPDRGSIASGGYEASCCKLTSAYVFTPEAGDIAVEQSLKTLREM